jgi:centromere protein C
MVTTRKKQQQKAGGRSGVVINKIDDSNDDLDGWFDSAQSPEAESKQTVNSSSKGDSLMDNGGNSPKKASRKKSAKTPKQQVDMTLRGAASEDYMEEERDQTSAKKYMSKLRKKGGTDYTSPDLSRVSTVAFSPRSEGHDDEEPMETNETEPKSSDGDESETENALMTQENDKENDVVAHQSAASGELNVASSEVDEDDGDDLGPPVLPQDGQSAGGSRSEDEKIDFDGNNDDYEDDDAGDEGPGFNMVHDPETPLTVREDRAKKEMEKVREERRKQRKEKGLESESDDNNEDDGDEDSKSTPGKKSKKHKKNKNRRVVFSPKGIPIANRDYETVPITALIEGSPDEDGPRRSRRAKVSPLEFWRGEKMQFGAHNEHGYIGKALGDMPVVTGIQKALPTPYKKRKQVGRKKGANKSSGKNDSSDTTTSIAEVEFNSKKLRRKYKFHDGEEAYLWDDIAEETADQSKLIRPASFLLLLFIDRVSFSNSFLALAEIIAYASRMEGSDLPISKKRKKSEGKVTGKAAQGFNVSTDENDDYVGYIMGNLLLPPGGIKDSESVGPCAQTFTVCRSQPKALEVAFGDPDQNDGEFDAETSQRFLLGPCDMFRVPPGNSYRLENHSETTECLLTWTIIRPRAVPT